MTLLAWAVAFGGTLGLALVLLVRRQNVRLRETERQAGERAAASETRYRELFETILVELSGGAEVRLDHLLPRIAEHARGLADTHGAFVLLVDGADLVHGGGAGVAAEALRRQPIEGSPLGSVIRDGRALVARDLAETPTWATSALARDLGQRAILAVPIAVRDRVLGVLALVQREPRDFHAEEMRLLGALATATALAIDHARRLRETQTRLRETETLLTTGRAVSSTLDLTEMVRRVAREIGRALGVDMVGAYLADPDGSRLRPIAGYHVPRHLLERFRDFPVPLVGHRLLEEPWRRGQPVWWSNGGDGAGLDAATLERFPHRSGLFVPMVGTGGPIGGLFLITWDHDRAYTLDEIRLVEGITRQAAIFTENARLYAAATRRRREAEELAGLARMITESLDVADVGQRTVDSARQLLDAESSTLRTLQPDGALRLIACSGPPSVGMTLGAIAPPGVGVVGRVIATGAPVWAADVLQDLGSTFPDEIRTPMLRTGARAVLAVPLRAKRQIIGVLTVGDRAPREFAESEVTLLQTFADQAAIALENGRLYGELQDALAAVEQSRERVVRGERLRALGEMAGGVAHDFNNLLTVIVGRAEALLEDATDPEVRRQAGVIIKVAEDAAQTVRRIQEFTRMRRARPFQRVDVSQLVAEVIDVTRSRWKEDAQARSIRYEVVAETVPVPAVIGDPSEIREALTNLLFNALDAMPGGGCVVIRTAVEDGRVLCTVADSGVGMTEDVRDRVFDPFFTTKGERGTGLGLSVVWGIVSRHGGEVDVQSHPGKGSVFTIRLPLPETPPAAAPSHTISRTVAAAKVLVVDDEDDVREALRDLLVRDGHRVVMCANGESALERFEAEAFDLVVTDLGMPRTTGWDVARAVKLRAPATPVVMVTGWGDHFDQDDAGKRGVDAVIAKPFRRDDLRVAVATALSRAASRGSPSGPGASPGSVPKSKGIP